MSDGSQIPPRFVPVLTEVVGEPQALPADGPPQGGPVARDGTVAGKLPGHNWIGRRSAPGLPTHLPPLPESLPPPMTFSMPFGKSLKPGLPWTIRVSVPPSSMMTSPLPKPT